MTLAHYHTTANLIKEHLNPNNNPPKKVKDLILIDINIAEFLSQFPDNYTVWNIGDALVVKSPMIRQKRRRWIWYTYAETPYWKEFLES